MLSSALSVTPSARPLGCVAQSVEQLTLNQLVVGSIPTAPTKILKLYPISRLTGHARRFADIARPSAIISVIIAVPPYEISGSGTPTTGTSPVTMAMLIVT